MTACREYCVYIMTNTHHTVLYTGVTNNLQRRVLEHKNGTGSTFTKKYNLHKLVYYEVGNNIHSAIARENKSGVALARKDRVDKQHKSRMERSLQGSVHLNSQGDCFASLAMT